jgi:hypothetical protein
MGMFAFFALKTIAPFDCRKMFYAVSICGELCLKIKQTKVDFFIAYHFLPN